MGSGSAPTRYAVRALALGYVGLLLVVPLGLVVWRTFQDGVGPFLAAITTPTIFILGSDDPYLSVGRARPSIDQIQGATLHEVPGGHAPWLLDPQRAADLMATINAVSPRRPLVS